MFLVILCLLFHNYETYQRIRLNIQIDILENEILDKYPDVLDVLLRDHTTQYNILWATNNYSDLGKKYNYKSEIRPESITGHNGNIIIPREKRDKIL
jgi:hypothetical protein